MEFPKSPVVTMMHIAMGVIPSIAMYIESLYCDDYFARSGALLVLLALLMIARSRVEAEEYLKTISAFIDNTAEPLLTGKVTNSKIYSSIDGSFIREKTFHEVLEDLRSYALSETNRWRNAELGALAFGTFLWGFGDLIVNFDACKF